MAKVEEEFTKKISNKFFEFQRAGLVQYSKYLDTQLEWASKESIREAYKKYIQAQIIDTKKKIEAIDEKMKL